MRFLLAILFCWSCVAATITTKTVKDTGLGGDYTSLSGWEAGRQSDLTASDTIELASIEGSWTGADTSAVTINGWTTDATRYICITNSTSKHDGKCYGSPAIAYRLEVSDATALNVNEDFVRIYGIQLKVASVTADRYGIAWSSITTGSQSYVGYCIFTSSSSVNGADVRAIYTADADCNLDIFNCIAHDMTAQDNVGGAFISWSGGTVNVYNCTGFKNYTDYVRNGGTANSYNCISQNTYSAVGAWSGTWAAGDYNVCTDGDDPPGSNPSDQTVDVSFVSETAPYDLHLAAADSSGVKDATSDQSSGLFADDIDYVTRSGSWDIGADEYVAAASSARQIIIIRQQ